VVDRRLSSDLESSTRIAALYMEIRRMQIRKVQPGLEEGECETSTLLQLNMRTKEASWMWTRLIERH
jgi:hypothetical protein